MRNRWFVAFVVDRPARSLAYVVPRVRHRSRSGCVRSPGNVVHPFDAPRSRFGAGHLGVDLAASPRHRRCARRDRVSSRSPVRSPARCTSSSRTREICVLPIPSSPRSQCDAANASLPATSSARAGGKRGAGHDGSVLAFRAAIRRHVRRPDAAVPSRSTSRRSCISRPQPIRPAPRAEQASGAGSSRDWPHGAGAVVHAAGALCGRRACRAARRWPTVGTLVAAGSGIRRFVGVEIPDAGRGRTRPRDVVAQRGHCDAHAPAADGTGGSDHRVMIVAGLDSSITNGGPSSALPAATARIRGERGLILLLRPRRR